MLRGYFKIKFFLAGIIDLILALVLLIVGINKYVNTGFSSETLFFFIASIVGFLICIILLIISRKLKERK